MEVLLLGATGNLGSRLIPALLTYHNTVVAYVRSPSKLESLLPGPVYQQITVIQGDATDATSVKDAILDATCDAVINTAGVAAAAPWGKSDLPTIFRAVLEGVKAAGVERGRPLRIWFLGGQSVLFYPGTETMLSNYSSIPIFREHRQNLELLRSLPPDTVNWSMLCPQTMTPESSDFSVPTKTSRGKLVANAGSPPLWQGSWMGSIPLLGRATVIGMNCKPLRDYAGAECGVHCERPCRVREPMGWNDGGSD